jgi:hypothetical protein
MTKLQFNGSQFTITISPEHIKRMNWKKGIEVYVAKDPDKNILYIEEMPKGKNKNAK